MTYHARALPGAVAAPEPAEMTYSEFLDLDGENMHLEWVQGRVVPMAAVTFEHTDLAGWLVGLLRFFIERRKLGRLLAEPFQMKTGPDLPGRSPDLFFVSKRNLARIKRKHLEGPADLAIEIIGPGSRGVDRGVKFFEYEQGGVREYWLIDPERRQAELYRLGRDGIYRLQSVGEDGVFRSMVLKGVHIRVEWLWRNPLPDIFDVLKEWGVV